MLYISQQTSAKIFDFMRKTGRSGCDQDRCGACRVESWGTLWNLTNSLERAESQGLGHNTNNAIVLCQKGLMISLLSRLFVILSWRSNCTLWQQCSCYNRLLLYCYQRKDEQIGHGVLRIPRTYLYRTGYLPHCAESNIFVGWFSRKRWWRLNLQSYQRGYDLQSVSCYLNFLRTSMSMLIQIRSKEFQNCY